MATSTNKTVAFGFEAIRTSVCRNTVTSRKLTVWCALWAGAVVPTRRRNISATARATIDLLKDTFGDRLHVLDPVNWPQDLAGI
ncbi:hypothetical protein TNCV_2661481 [Trichonephila clavipes]|nr:hypothetical protein TNCV_2661481 [Trichonephila clavipes]